VLSVSRFVYNINMFNPDIILFKGNVFPMFGIVIEEFCNMVNNSFFFKKRFHSK
jgi:hypothetical protein